MRTTLSPLILFFTCLLLLHALHGQEPSAFNQHAYRGNHSRLSFATDPWSFGVTTGAAFSVKSTENTLFRGNSMTTKMFGRYYFGNVGLGLATGITPGTINKNALNKFITDRKFPQDQVQVNTASGLSSYVLFGPSFRFGRKVYVSGDIQAGMFFNNPGGVNITQQNAAKSLYRFDNGDKNIFPGFSGGININYPLDRTTHFLISAEYLQSKTSVRLMDPQQGIDVTTQVNRDVRLFTAGIGIVKSFGGRRGSQGAMGENGISRRQRQYENGRETRSGMASGRIITIGNNNGLAAPRDAQTGMASGRIYGPGQPIYGNVQQQASCGPVTLMTTNPDGTTQQQTFSCPEDAAQYAQRLSMNVTTPKQTNSLNFGEKVSSGLHAAGNVVAQGASRGIIYGTISWDNGNSSGIVTNEMIANNSGGGGAAAASYAATGKMMNDNSTSEQTITMKIYAREAGNGLATGRRQFQSVYNDEGFNTCTDCGVTVRLLAHEAAHTVQQFAGDVKTNPLYEDKGTHGENPMSAARKGNNNGNLCGSTGHFFVTLSDPGSGQPVVSTKADSSGNFWFTNVPVGTYQLAVTGETLLQKSYDMAIDKNGQQDIAGELQAGHSGIRIELNTVMDDSTHQQSKVIVRGWNPEKKEAIGSAINSTFIISSLVAGSPVSGTVVKKDKNSSAQSQQTTTTNEYGEFEFKGLEKGDYTITANIDYPVNEKTIVTVGGNTAENIVTSESTLKVDANARKGWDGTVKGGSKTEARQPDAQNNNTVRSNRSAFKCLLVEADLDGDGTYETDVTNKVNGDLAIEDKGIAFVQPTANDISRSKSNVKNNLSSMENIGEDVYRCYGSAIINGKEVAIQSILKTKHDTAKNAVGNIR